MINLFKYDGYCTNLMANFSHKTYPVKRYLVTQFNVIKSAIE